MILSKTEGHFQIINKNIFLRNCAKLKSIPILLFFKVQVKQQIRHKLTSEEGNAQERVIEKNHTSQYLLQG